MEQLEKPTTSVNYGLNVTSTEVDELLRNAFRGRSEVHDRLADLPLKRLSTPIEESAPQSSDVEVEDDYEHEYSRDTEVKKRLGRGALSRALKNADKWIAYGTGLAISKLPGTKSMEERAEIQTRLNEKYADKAGDSWLRQRINYLQRNRLNIYNRLPVHGLGAIASAYALTRYGAPVVADLGGDAVHGISEWINQPRTITIGQDLAANAIDYTPVERAYDSKAILIGGRGDTTSVFLYSALEAQGGVAGTTETVDYPAGIAPVDPVRMDISAAIAADGASNFYDPNDPSQQTIYGYSEGSAGAIDAYNQIVADNGGVKPENLELILLGSPYAEGGFFKSDYASVASPVLNAMGIPVDKEVPAGATVIYSPNDFWANGDNQSFLGMMSQLADLGGAGHDPSVTGEFYEKIDENGVRHLIKAGTEHALVELAEKHGMPLPEGTSEILQQIAPINNGMSEEVPQPNAYAAVDMTGDLIDRETRTNIGSAFTDNVPQEWQDLGQSSLVAVNNIPNTAAAIANGQMSPQEGIPLITNQVQDVMQDIGTVMQDPIGAAQNMIHESIQDAIPPEAQPFVAPFIQAFLPPR